MLRKISSLYVKSADIYKIKKLIQLCDKTRYNDVYFGWEPTQDFFYIIEGDYGNLFNFEIKPYSFENFSELVYGAPIMLYFSNTQYVGLCNTDSNIRDNSNFEWKITEIVDYPKTITALEEQNIVKTRKSLSQLATDNRCFSVDEEEWWEVDILGTLFGKDITNKILQLYSANLESNSC